MDADMLSLMIMLIMITIMIIMNQQTKPLLIR